MTNVLWKINVKTSFVFVFGKFIWSDDLENNTLKSFEVQVGPCCHVREMLPFGLTVGVE